MEGLPCNALKNSGHSLSLGVEHVLSLGCCYGNDDALKGDGKGIHSEGVCDNIDGGDGYFAKSCLIDYTC